jgi:hypothetical protein
MADRKKLADRIRALLSKTVDRGCTEAEAIAAAEMAKRLMDEYQMNLSDLEIEQEGVTQETADKYKGGFDAQSRLAMSIAAFCEVKTWRTNGRMVYFGLASDVEFAKWLTVALESFCWIQADEYQMRQRMLGIRTDWTDRRSFVQGCVSRLNERLTDEVRARRKTAGESTGRSLVVVKSQLIAREFAKTGITLRTGHRSDPGHRSGAYGAGRAAGDRAGFGRPVSGGGQRMIGGR